MARPDRHRTGRGPTLFVVLAIFAPVCLLPPKAGARDLVSLEVVALEGEPAPGLAPGVVFKNFADLPILDADGAVIFTAELEGTAPPTFQPPALFGPDAAGTQTLVLRVEEPVGGGPELLDSVRVAASIDGTYLLDALGTFNERILRAAPPAAPADIAVIGDEAPGTGGGTFASLELPAVTLSGEAVFFGTYEGGAGAHLFREGLWRIAADGSLLPAMVTGTAAPGTGTSFFSLTNPAVTISRAGTIAFIALAGGNGLWTESAGTQTLHWRQGDAAPGAAPGQTFSVFQQPLINASDEIAFGGSLQGPGVDGTNRAGLWGPGTSGGIALKAREGDAAPGAAVGSTFIGFSGPQLLDSGSVVFFANLDGEPFGGIWRAGRDGALTPLVLQGDPVEEMPPGSVVEDIGTAWSVNERGEVVFMGRLSGPGIDDFPNDEGVFAVRDGDVVPLIFDGDLLEVAPGDLRTVSTAVIVGAFWKRYGQLGWNDAGQAAMLVGFTDFTRAIVVATLAPPVPAAGPAGIALLGLGLLVAAGWAGGAMRARGR